jgi:Fic family protein
MTFIYEHIDWTQFRWDEERIVPLLLKVRHLQGRVVGKMNSLGFELKNLANLDTLTIDVIKSSEIEGEDLNIEQVRSSLARRLGLDVSGLIPSDRNVDGIVELLLDATHNFDKTLTKERLFDWHNSLFPGDLNVSNRIITGNWRDDSTGPMQVVSGAMGKETIHYQAPKADVIEDEMSLFLNWFNYKNDLDLVIKSAIAHLWFVTLHPFEDGNGRIARAISDMLLTRSDGQPQRFYSMSAQIRKERKEYYNILELTQKGDSDITLWLEWFLNCLFHALESSEDILKKVIIKHEFWNKNAISIDNNRQKLMLNKLLDGMEGNLTTTKWAKICKCSQDTALRDIQDLLIKGILRKSDSGGRSTNYELVE